MTDLSDRGNLLTEALNPASENLDQLSTLELVDVINAEDAKVAVVVAQQREAIARAIDLAAASLRKGGRLVYVGAGTSGRLGVLDAAECPPTFQTDPQQVQGAIAGGFEALVRSAEGKEDEWAAGVAEMVERQISAVDVVMGIAAGGTTPYVRGALAEARDRGAATLFFACVPENQVPMECDVNLRVSVGPEVLAGSTRMKAGTATKLVLNAISTGVMVQLGKVYGNLMVDVAVTNAKLRDRAIRILTTLTDCDRPEAEALLESAELQVKPALLMYWSGCEYAIAQSALARADGNLRVARNQLR
ncbi:N-acetylmuramic acid 6-phosphate etherase [Synechococcus sp. PCC 7336]|uniref:N-acetylmuramic acid 6-phosphate etherase n=1 Tax=Synechococcus sp. PCC 7336 TaxID=195250 RepID=UPI000349CD1A|nr:N-acetylmuramic acid 6-phosphate etherase [Synechococcus sp. PCC 7336]